MKGAYWPTVSLEGVYLRKEEDTTFSVGESIYGGLRLTFPFFDGGLRKAELRQARARQRQAVLGLEDVKKSVDIQVEEAYLGLMTQRELFSSLRQQVVFARDNHNAVSRQFEAGLANSLDVMDANTLLVTSERQVADAELSCELLAIRLMRETGILLKTVLKPELKPVEGDRSP